MSFELLSEPIKKYIRYQGWTQLRPIQHAAIQKILGTDEHYILASRTASGKTEAAFLPILSSVDFNGRGVKVLYISPLIALINDQFERVEELCKDLEIPVTKWHGEAAQGAKNALVKNPAGIVLITPESIEAMFVHKPYQVRDLFASVKFVVIDEIHSFIGTDRGLQLQSILQRLKNITESPFRIVGLSATVGDYEQAKKFTGDTDHTKVLLDRTAKEIEVHFRYFKTDTEELPLDLLKDLYLETKDNKVLIFPNSRGRAEEIAVKLKKISDRVKGHPNYFSHHSSVDREVREYVEDFAKNSQRSNFCISCTSTLELGIDIGSVDEVIQVDATHSVASLIQRIGRSGRRGDEKSRLFLYATGPWILLQSIACWLLFTDGKIDALPVNEKPYDVLLHQILSIVKGHSGIVRENLKEQLSRSHVFSAITNEETDETIDHLLTINFLEKIGHELIIGIEGERIVNSRDFYSMFETPDDFQVICKGQKVGELPYTPQIREGENILLAAKIWKIQFVDEKSKKVEVLPAKDGKKPMFFGNRGNVHEMIRMKMMEVLFSSDQYPFLDEASADALSNLRQDFHCFHVTDTATQRLLLPGEKNTLLYTFTGSRVNNTLEFLLEQQGFSNIIVDEDSSCLEIPATAEDVHKAWHQLARTNDLDARLETYLEKHPGLLRSSKWSIYLPTSLQIELLKFRYFDFERTFEWLTTINLIQPSSSND